MLGRKPVTDHNQAESDRVNYGHAVLIDQLIAFVNGELAAGIVDPHVIDAETPILELGILDSLAMVSLLAFIHARFGVHVPDEAVIPENFENLGCLASLIAAQQTQQRTTAHTSTPT